MKIVARAHWILAAAILALPLAATDARSAEPKDKPADAPPRVLIIGDSISLGYTPHVKRMLKGKAEVVHNRGNAQHTATGLKRLDSWLGKGKWDVIHFNWGLWDLCYRHPESKVQGRRDKVRGKITIPLEQYGKNLDRLVARLKKTKAVLIWGHTTVVPEKEAGRFAGDAAKYNAIAAKVMKKHGVAVNDLHKLTKSFPPSLFVAPGNVHFTKAGSEKLAKQVAAKIAAALRGESLEDPAKGDSASDKARADGTPSEGEGGQR
ncbi:MAG: SGNH/GDSL hydrolase family protein [Planctomycetota bacterium]|jgi:lysophospholipase L1-like esterase